MKKPIYTQIQRRIIREKKSLYTDSLLLNIQVLKLNRIIGKTLEPVANFLNNLLSKQYKLKR